MTTTSRIILLSLLLVGCAGPTTTVLGPYSLSLFETAGDGLAWQRVDPDKALDARVQVLATLPGASGSPYVAWRKDLGAALTWIHPGYDADAKATPAWEVDLAGGTGAKPLGLPTTGGTVLDVGYDAAGLPLALTMELHNPVQEPLRDVRGTYLMYGSMRFDIPEGRDGIPVIVHAFRRDAAGTWSLIETGLSSTGWDFAQGVSSLAAAKTLGLRSNAMLESGNEFKSVTDKALLPELMRLKPPEAQDGDEWVRFEAAPVFSWTVIGDFAHPTSRLAMLDETGAPQALPDTPGRMIAAGFREGRMLVSDASDGKHPRLFELKTRGVVYSSETASGVTFWPTPEPTVKPTN